MTNSPSISASASQLPRPLFTFTLFRKALRVVGMQCDMPADAGLTVFDSTLRLVMVSCRADCDTGGVNRWSVWDCMPNNAYHPCVRCLAVCRLRKGVGAS